MKAHINNTQIYFDIAGMQLAPHKGQFIERPVIFILHGGPGGDHLRFKLNSLQLQDVAQLVFIDNRGCGRSEKTAQKDYTLKNNIKDLEALRQYLGLEKIILLGTSYGGIVAQGYAIQYPKQVQKLILVATAPSYRFIDEAQEYLHKHGTPQQIACAKHLWQGNFTNERQIQKFFTVMDPLYSVTAKIKKKPVYDQLPTRWSKEALNQGFGDFLRKFDFIPDLKKIKCPALILAGDKDWICQPNQAKILAKHIKDAQLKIFKNCGHAVANDAQQKYLRAIINFLKKN